MINKLFGNYKFFVIQFALCIIGYIYDSILYFQIATFLILLFCIIHGGKQRYVINPYYLLILTPISLLIYFNIADIYLLDLTTDTWLLIVCNINALLIGFRITAKTKFRERILSKTEGQRLYTLTGLAFVIIGIIPQLIFRYTGIDIPLSYIITMMATAGVLCAMATRKKIVCFLTVAIYILPITLGGASKTGVLTLLLALIVSMEKFYLSYDSLAAYRRLRKKIIFGCALTIPCMIYAFTFANKDRGSYDAEAGFTYFESRGVNWDYNKSLFMPYMYIVTPWANLQYVTETQDNRSYGYWFTKPILGIFLEDTLKEDNYVPESYSNFNTFSFIGLHFKDFGYWGSIFASLFLGFFIKKVYSLYVQSPSPYDAAAYVFTAQATLELFFSNHFFGQSYPFMIVIVMYLFKKLNNI